MASRQKKTAEPVESKDLVEYMTKAQKIRQPKRVEIDRALAEVIEEHGHVTAKELVELATPVDSPLHKFFDWDDEVAGEKWRVTQATAMLLASKMVAVIQDEDTKGRDKRFEVRGFLSVGDGEGFRMRKEVLDSDEMRSALIERRIATLKSWCRESIDVPELAELREAILERIDKLSVELEVAV
jgi:hypothetical protein